MISRRSPVELAAELSEKVRELLGFEPRLEHLAERKGIADQTEKWMVALPNGKRTAIVICSPNVAPAAVGDAVAVAEEVRCALGETLGRVILRPLSTGHLGELTFVVFPYCHAIDGSGLVQRFVRIRVRDGVLRWLRSVTARTARDAEHPGEFLNSLAVLEDCEGLDSAIRRDASAAARSLELGRWKPVHVLMHGDMWMGNVMLTGPVTWLTAIPGRSRRDIVIIDWAGAQINGYAIFDLLRFARTVRMSAVQIRREVAGHCAALGCEILTARAHLLCALGAIRKSLGCFPEQRFIEMARACHRILDLVPETTRGKEQ